MSDTKITLEERAEWREQLESPLSCHDAEHRAFTLCLLDALDAAEAENARLQQRVNELLCEKLAPGAVRERVQLRYTVHEILQENAKLRSVLRDWISARDAVDAEAKRAAGEWSSVPLMRQIEAEKAARRAVEEE